MSITNPIEILPADKIAVFKIVAKTFGTPVYVYFENELINNLQSFLRISAPYGLIIRYAVKANSQGAILRLFNKYGAQFDASTFNECIRIIKGAGIEGEKIRLTSQEIQSPENLRFLAKNGVLYTACSLLQLETYGKTFPNTEIGIRFNIGIGSGTFLHITTGGKKASFGIYEQREEIKSLLKKYNLTLKTIHLHIGSGSDPKKQKKAIKEGLKLVKNFPTVTTLDMGGGFKVGDMSNEYSTDIKEIGQTMISELKNFKKETNREILLELEPGTALVAKAGYILTEIIDIVTTGTKGEKFLKVNGGMTMNARISMYGAQHPIIVIPEDKNKRNIEQYVVVGTCCESGDTLTVRPLKPGYIAPRQMLEAKLGDLLVLGRAGAYCSSMSPMNYNSHQMYPEVLVRSNGQIDNIRIKQPLEDIWKYERIPDNL